jgi:hypothetical protein
MALIDLLQAQVAKLKTASDLNERKAKLLDRVVELLDRTPSISLELNELAPDLARDIVALYREHWHD